MTPERWQQVKELLGVALEHEPGQRPQFLAEACAGDGQFGQLRMEVKSLLAYQEQAASFIEAPAFNHSARGLKLNHFPGHAQPRHSVP